MPARRADPSGRGGGGRGRAPAAAGRTGHRHPGAVLVSLDVYACCTPPAQKERAFAAARASGAGYMRIDVNLRGVFTARKGKPRRPAWDGLDQIAALGRRYRLPVWRS